MTYGLISDIHGNLEALEAVLPHLDGVDAYVCLGDIVGYGADPGSCIERVRELPGLRVVAGNHDIAVLGRFELEWFNPFARAAIEWTQEHVSADDKSYLASLPLTAHVEGALLVHGSLPEEMDYITSVEDARVCFDAMPGDLALVGHTHISEYYVVRQETRFPQQVSLRSGGRVELESGLRYIVNPGAVGQPRDGNPDASFGVWDVDAGFIEVRRIPYDMEGAQEKIVAAGLPPSLAERLTIGH